MVKIDFNLIKEIRDTTDWLLAFPEKLISAVMKPQETFLKRLERIHRFREIGKALQPIYSSTGSLIDCIDEMQSGGDPKDAVHIRGLLGTISCSIADARQALIDTSISVTSFLSCLMKSC